MSKPKDVLLEMSQKITSLSEFRESYNESIPPSFPQASTNDLKQFEIIHFRLFSKSGEWSLEKHRKRLMDWLPSHHHRMHS